MILCATWRGCWGAPPYRGLFAPGGRDNPSINVLQTGSVSEAQSGAIVGPRGLLPCGALRAGGCGVRRPGVFFRNWREGPWRGLEARARSAWEKM